MSNKGAMMVGVLSALALGMDMPLDRGSVFRPRWQDWEERERPAGLDPMGPPPTREQLRAARARGRDAGTRGKRG